MENPQHNSDSNEYFQTLVMIEFLFEKAESEGDEILQSIQAFAKDRGYVTDKQFKLVSKKHKAFHQFMRIQEYYAA
jgi:hypothetical protein